MRVIVFCSPRVIGTVDRIGLGDDGFWLHLSECSPGTPLQSFALDDGLKVRPYFGCKDGKSFMFRLEDSQ